MVRLLINLVNCCRVSFWRLVLTLRGGRIGRGVTIQPGVCLACHPGHPIILGDGVQLMRGVVLSTSETGRIVLDENVYIGEYGVVTSNAEIHIGRDTLIAPHADLVDFNHRTDDLTRTVMAQAVDAAPIHIGRDVWIGAGAKILRGVTLGDQSIVGAGSVVNHNVPERGVAVGAPARVIRRRGSDAKPAAPGSATTPAPQEGSPKA